MRRFLDFGSWHPEYSHELPVPVIAPGTETAIHDHSLTVSTCLSRLYVKNFVSPTRVIDALNRTGARFILSGSHAVGGWANTPRATADVDVLLVPRHVRRAVAAIGAGFPRLVAVESSTAIQFWHPRSGNVLIDLKKQGRPLYCQARQHTYRITTRRRSYCIPSREFALAMTFDGIRRATRDQSTKLYGVARFMEIVKANPVIDLAQLRRLGELLYAGGGREVLEMVRRVRSGEPLEL